MLPKAIGQVGFSMGYVRQVPGLVVANACAALFLFAFAVVFCTIPVNAMSLKQAVRAAVQENPTANAERSNVRASASEFEAGAASFGPSVDIFGDVGAQRKKIATSGITNSNFTREVGLRASILLFDGYERANRLYQSAANIDQATYRLLATAETVALNAVEAYVDVVRHRRLVSASRDNIARHRDILSQIRKRVDGGTSPVSDRIQIEERVYAAEAVAVEIETALRDAQARFRQVVGVSPKGKMTIPRVRNLPVSLNQFVANSIANHYKIKEAQKAVNGLEYSRDATNSALLPRISLEGKASVGEDRAGSRGDESDLYVGLRLAWKIYDHGVSSARDQVLADRVSEAEYRKEAVIRDIRQVAETAWNALVSSRKRHGIVSSQLASNREIATSYRKEYELSKRSLLDVLDAQSSLFSSQFSQISVAAVADFSRYRMLATMSRLNSHFGIDVELPIQEYDVETMVVSDPMGVFNLSIEPLR